MPRFTAPPPSGEFTVRLTKPFSGQPTHTVEIIGEPNRSAVAKVSQYNGSNKSSEKTGDVPKDDVNELVTLISTLRGFPSHPSTDIYGIDTKIELNTFEIQWASDDDDSVSNEATAENKDEHKRVADSIEALGRTFAKRDSAV